MITAENTYDTLIDTDGQLLIKHTSNNVTKYLTNSGGLERTMLHRIGGPAFETPTMMEYYQEGKLHREDGPAVITDSRKAWYLNGMLHRLDGPAIEHLNGKLEYYQNNVRHREDGPAIVYPSGAFEYYLHGQLHRKDGPARLNHVCAEYYLNGRRHRAKEPAVIYVSNIKEYWLKGQRHRKGFPAIIVPETDDSENYWIEGDPYISKNAKEIVIDGKVSKLQDIHAWIIGNKSDNYKFHQDDGRPALVTDDEIKYFRQGVLHNQNGPAIIGHQRLVWYKNNYMHRDRGAAFVWFGMENIVIKYYREGHLHNYKGPAYINIAKNRVEWHINGVLQRSQICSDEVIQEHLSDAFLDTFGELDMITQYMRDVQAKQNKPEEPAKQNKPEEPVKQNKPEEPVKQNKPEESSTGQPEEPVKQDNACISYIV